MSELNGTREALTVIDYGGGNLASVVRAFRRLGVATEVTAQPRHIVEARHGLVLPGVGHFGAVMRALDERGLREPILQAVRERKVPFLGVCVGMQVLFRSSEEAPGVGGLALLEGECRRFASRSAKVPQIGWNHVDLGRSAPHGEAAPVPPQADGLTGYVYFVNSYYCVADEATLVADPRLEFTQWAHYAGVRFLAGLRYDNITAYQYHPEKSGPQGLALLKHWIGTAQA